MIYVTSELMNCGRVHDICDTCFGISGTGLIYITDGRVVQHVLQILDNLCEQTRE
ncbi:Proprotein convertase subtilisin/kexin type 6 [Gossypium arboreum]|uniref:Proprotein convertase subtilisin/kexin type 6 n=1 Tax=Gossypium arboreum TaxID=29729 RepID=A0A0B0MU19_GOSAR|nr:Proprotein convertase subtilisin/kexin type 6 [Gossypium arboreum]